MKDEKSAKRLSSKPQFIGFHMLDEQNNFFASKVKRNLVLNKPIACGFIVLKISKNIMIMGEFWYDALKPKYGSNIILFFNLKIQLIIIYLYT